MAERISLQNARWELAGVTPSGEPAEGDWFEIPFPATVRHAHEAKGRPLPSNWADLEWVYRCRFSCPHGEERVVRLMLAGVDYRSGVVLNGEQLGENKGAYGPVWYDVSSTVADENTLAVRVRAAVNNRDRLLSPNRHPLRFENTGDPIFEDVGIWDDVAVVVTGPLYFDGWLVNAFPDGDGGEVVLRIDVNNTQNTTAGHVRVTLFDGETEMVAEEQAISMPSGISTHEVNLILPRVEAWYPHNVGRPKLYDMRMELVRNEDSVDTVAQPVGFRKVKINRTGERDKAWQVAVNGKPVELRGINWAALPLAPGRDYGAYVRSLREAGVNAVRVWGGRHRRAFYEACDREGLLVHQEFPYGLMDGFTFPPQTRDFPGGKDLVDIARLDNNAYVRHLRNHPSIFLWVGGTRIHNQDNQHIMRTVEEALRVFDGTRPYVPTLPTEHVQTDFEVRTAGLSPEHLEDGYPLLIAQGLPAWKGDKPDNAFSNRWKKYGGESAQARAIAWAVGGQRYTPTAGGYVGEMLDWSPDGGYGLHDYQSEPRLGWKTLAGLYAALAIGLSFDWKAWEKGAFEAEVWAVADDGRTEQEARVWVTDADGREGESVSVKGSLEGGRGVLGDIKLPLSGKAPFTAWVGSSDTQAVPYPLDARKPVSAYSLAEVSAARQRLATQTQAMRPVRDIGIFGLLPVELLLRGIFALRLAMGV